MIFEDLNIIAVLPEIVLLIFTILSLFISGVGKKLDYDVMVRFAGLSFIAVIYLLIQQDRSSITAFTEMYLSDAFTNYMKIFVCLASFLAILLSGRYLKVYKADRLEYPALIMFSCLGMMTLFSANNLIPLYIGLEMMTLPIYVLATISNDDKKATEAGMKYFLSGIFSTALFLYGVSLVYGFTGSMGFDDIAVTLSADVENTYVSGVGLGLMMMIIGVAFKIGVVPFHMWVPDIFQGASTPAAIFFSVAPKLTMLALLGRLLVTPFFEMAHLWQGIVIAISILSMVFGSVAALAQTNIKRLLGYSAIVHMGYALIGLACVTEIGIEALMVYITIYSVTILGAFALVLLMQKKGVMVDQITDLSGWWKTRPHTSFAFTVILLSMAGLPPLAGFFSKMLILQAAINVDLIYLAVIGVLSSAVAVYYYLYVIKVMYFDKTSAKLDKLRDPFILFVVNLSAVVLVMFPVFMLEGLLELVKEAVRVFFR